jgi:hypothetical protein
MERDGSKIGNRTPYNSAPEFEAPLRTLFKPSEHTVSLRSGVHDHDPPQFVILYSSTKLGPWAFFYYQTCAFQRTKTGGGATEFTVSILLDPWNHMHLFISLVRLRFTAFIYMGAGRRLVR